MHEDRLACAIELLAHELHALHNNNAVLHRIDQLENNIMSKLSEYLANQKAFNTTLSANVDSVVTSQAGIAADVASLNEKIIALQNSSGEVNAEDGALIDALQADGAALVAKVEAAAAALKLLDDATPPVVPNA